MVVCRKVFKRLNFELSVDVIEALVSGRVGTIERVLLLMRTKIDRALQEKTLAQQLGASSDRRLPDLFAFLSFLHS